MRKNILLIHDKKKLENHYTSLLSEVFDVTVASDLKQALVYLESNLYICDLVICDIFMEDINGFKVFDFFKSDSTFSHLSFIFKTSSTNKDIYNETIIARGCDLINDQMPNEEILARLHKAANSSKIIKLFSNKKEIVFVADKLKNRVLFPKLSIPIELTPTEVKILDLLAKNPTPNPKGEILSKCFCDSVVITDNNFNTTLSKLRRKLEFLNVDIVTKRNVGTYLHYL